MGRLDAILRRLVPSVPVLSRNRLLMAPLDLLDRIASLVIGAGTLPPNRYRIRVGVGNRILFNQMLHRTLPVDFWLYALAAGLARLDGRILDLGCGCGRYAATLRDFEFYGARFSGRYTGIDVDAAMIDWCRRHFPADRFAFHVADARSSVYNPAGKPEARPRYDVEDATQDFAFAVSLLTHLLEADFRHCLAETARMLAPGASMVMTVFCLEHFPPRRGGRWTFRHRVGAAAVENLRYPEAAVAYPLDFIRESCAAVGFDEVEVRPGAGHSLLVARRAGPD